MPPSPPFTAVQAAPPLTVLYTPPPSVPAHTVIALVGSTTSAGTSNAGRPLPAGLQVVAPEVMLHALALPPMKKLPAMLGLAATESRLVPSPMLTFAQVPPPSVERHAS